MKVAVCDPDSFYPLRSLVSGPLETLGDLVAIERFVRTVVLHDEMRMELSPCGHYDPDSEAEYAEEDERRGYQIRVTGIGPILDGYDFFTHGLLPLPEIELNPALLEIAAKFANAGDGNVYFEAHVDYLKRIFGVIEQGGSALISGDFWRQAITAVEKYPELLFQQLDREWQTYAQSAQEGGLGLTIPPLLGIVLTRCARRDAIATVIRDLRDEWATPRKKVWKLLDELRSCRTLEEAEKIRRELTEASRLFSPKEGDFDSRPVRILWDIVVACAAGAGIAKISGGNAMLGAATGTIAKVASSAPGLLHEFGSVIFGRGAFDLAKRVRREVAQMEFDALRRLLTDAEKRALNLG